MTRRTAELGRTTSGATYSGARTVFDQAASRSHGCSPPLTCTCRRFSQHPPCVLGELSLSPPRREQWGAKLMAYSPFTALATRQAFRQCRCRFTGTLRACRSE